MINRVMYIGEIYNVLEFSLVKLLSDEGTTTDVLVLVQKEETGIRGNKRKFYVRLANCVQLRPDNFHLDSEWFLGVHNA